MAISKTAVEVYIAANPIAAHRLRLELESEGIDARVVGDLLQGAAGELPLGMASAPAIWVPSGDAVRAREIAIAWEAREAARPSAAAGGNWNCPSCGAVVAGYMDECPACDPAAGDTAPVTAVDDSAESDFSPLFENRRMAIAVGVLIIPVVAAAAWFLLRIEPSTPQGLNYRGWERYEAGDYHGAIADFEKCLFGNRYDSGPYTGIASAQFMLGRYEFARENFTRALGRDPTYTENYLWRGWCHYHLGADGDAAADLNLRLKADPYDVEALDLLAWLRCTSPVDEVRDGSQALELAQRAQKLSELNNFVVRSTLAAAYAETGDYQSAKRLISEVLTEVDAANRAECERIQQAIEQEQPYRDLFEYRGKDEVIGGDRDSLSKD